MASMRKGSKSLPREVWQFAAREHIGFAIEISQLSDFSLQLLEHVYAGRPGAPDLEFEVATAETLEALARVGFARGRAEHSVSIDPDKADEVTETGRIENELMCLLMALGELAGAHRREARICIQLATERRIGRPKSKPINAIAALANGSAWKAKPKGTPGRKHLVPIADEELILMVDRGRAEFGAQSVRETVRSVAHWHLERTGALPLSEWRKDAAIGEIATNLEKRVSALRSRLRKSEKK